MDSDEEPPIKKSRVYSASGIKSSLHGTIYQLKLLMLFLKRGLDNGYLFKLATEMDAAEKFDDLVFQYTDNESKKIIYRLLQAKHKQDIVKDKITVGKLRSKDDKEPFSLQKYFISYLKIKEKDEFKDGEIKDFIICTNTDFDFGINKGIQGEEEERWMSFFNIIDDKDEILNIGGQRYRFIDRTFDSSVRECTREVIISELNQVCQEALKEETEKVEEKIKKLNKTIKKERNLEVKKEKEKKLEEAKKLKEAFEKKTELELYNNIEEFLNKLVFAVSQPNEVELGELIKNEIGENLNEIASSLIADSFQREMLDWMKEKDGRFLSHEEGKSFFDKVKQTLSKLMRPPAECLPEQWNVPTKNGDFTGRVELLEQILGHFSRENTPVILTACHGLGGVGKTQVALEFVWQHYKNYKGVVWFDALSKERLQEDYINLGRELNIIHDEEKISAEERVRYVKHWLENPSREGWLLVYDNAPNYDDISELLPTKKGNLLITSRHTQWPQESITIDVFTIEESRAYIQKVLGNLLSESDRAQIDNLAETLGRLPLALTHATAYIKKNPVSISYYLEIYQEKKRDLLANETLLSGFNYGSNYDSVYITWDITMEMISRESLLAANWLNICACLNGTDIPDFLLQSFAKIRQNNPTSQIYQEALGTLSSYSMLAINRQRATASIHNLVQEVIRLKWEIEEKKNYLIAVFQLLKECFPYGRDKLVDYDKKRRLLGHLEAFLPHLDSWQQEDPFKEEIEEDYLKQILIWTADAYWDVGDAQKQRNVLERALKIDEKHYGPDHPQVAIRLTNLSNAYGDLGDYQKKRELLERTLQIDEKNYGPEHPDVAITLTNLGNAYGALGDALKHRELSERALRIEESYYGPEDPELASTLTSLGNAYGALGDAQKQRELLERALLIDERHYGPDHPEVAVTLTNLSNAYSALGDAQKQRELLERALPIDERHYGPNHPNIVITLMNLGNAYGALGDAQKQCELLERALPISERYYGPDHPQVAMVLTNLGNAYEALGNAQKQREFLERALRVNENYYGPDHPSVAITLTNLGNAYGNLGNAQKQRELQERALGINEKYYGSNHSQVTLVLTNLSNAYGNLGDAQKQLDLLETALPLQENYYGPDHPQVAITLTNLSNAYGILGDAQKQRELLERALSIKEKHYGPDHPNVATTLTNLGIAYGALEDAQKQRELLERALAIHEKHYGPNHPNVATTLMSLGNAYGALGDTQKQCKFLEDALSIYERHYGSDHPKVANTLRLIGNVYGALWDAEKQREYVERALKIDERHYGPTILKWPSR